MTGYELVPLAEGGGSGPGRAATPVPERVRTTTQPLSSSAAPLSASGSNLIPELGLPHAQDEDGSLVLEGQGQLL